ncbi:MAG: DUF21 domain-containing protein [Chitinivibrionia bacterium]|nr:DUF21 domain-containing protein [Chitinivibrionia bacterium]
MSAFELGIISLACFILGAFFSGSETAFIASSRIRLRHLYERGNSRAGMVLNLLDDPKSLMSSVLVGANLAIIGCTSTFTALATRSFAESGASIATVVLVPLFLVFVDMLPKGIFLYYGSRAAISSVVPLRFFTVLMYPVVKLFSILSGALMRLLRMNKRERESLVTLDELLYHLEDSKEAGLISKETMTLAERALALKQLTLIRAMEPRYGRLDLEEPYLVHKDTPLVRMLFHMQNRGCQMALVKDGERIAGMLTLENILEQLVGAIADEYH